MRGVRRRPRPSRRRRCTGRWSGVCGGGVVSNAVTFADEEIAGQLLVSPATVKTHVSRGPWSGSARGIASQLVVFAYEAGPVRPGWTTWLSARSCITQACSRTCQGDPAGHIARGQPLGTTGEPTAGAPTTAAIDVDAVGAGGLLVGRVGDEAEPGVDRGGDDDVGVAPLPYRHRPRGRTGRLVDTHFRDVAVSTSSSC
jgi:hypothetical protein